MKCSGLALLFALALTFLTSTLPVVAADAPAPAPPVPTPPAPAVTPLSTSDKITVQLPPPAKLPSSPGFHMVQATVHVGQVQFPLSFGLFLPPSYFKTKDLVPVVVAIHNRGMEGVGASSGTLGCEGMAYLWVQSNWDPRDQVVKPLPNAVNLHTSARFIGVAPQCPKDYPLEIAPMPRVLSELIYRLGNAYRTDQNRVYLTGFSWGGTHTWQIAEQTPDRYAAIVPISGKASPDPQKTIATLSHVPVYLACGDADPYFAQFCRQMNDALVAGKHPDFVYRVIPGGNHFSYPAVYTDPAFWDWLLSKRRHPRSTTQPAPSTIPAKP